MLEVGADGKVVEFVEVAVFALSPFFEQVDGADDEGALFEQRRAVAGLGVEVFAAAGREVGGFDVEGGRVAFERRLRGAEGLEVGAEQRIAEDGTDGGR